MTTEEAIRRLAQLEGVLDAFDWDAARSVCQEIVHDVWTTSAEIPVSILKPMLDQVRRKRQFELLERFSEGFLLAGLRAPVVRRQYAQALIEQGRFASAEYVLRSMLDEPRGSQDHVEALGLIGRVYKQLYVEARGVGPSERAMFLDRAMEEYWTAYDLNPRENHWHGINVVALTTRAQKAGHAIRPGIPPPATLARQLLSDLDALTQARMARAVSAVQLPEGPPAFELATRVEALVALRNFGDARKAAERYVEAKGTDAFELGSTDRQLREVWRLDVDPDPDAAKVLAIIRAKLLARQGGAVSLSPGGAQGALDAARDLTLEAVLAGTGSVTLEWYSAGLACCNAVVQIQTTLKEGFGTGWFVDGGALCADWAGQVVMVTNKHVVSPAVNGQRYQPAPEHVALLPEEAVIHHQLSNTRIPVKNEDLLWSSDDLRLDASVVRVRKLPKGAMSLRVSPVPVQMANPPERVYIIGHPAGRGVELSLQDNLMLACDESRVHYRAPTQGGSSGSPVFDRQWNVIALHHGGGQAVRRLDGSGGRYAANEGIAIAAVREEIAARPKRP